MSLDDYGEFSFVEVIVHFYEQGDKGVNKMNCPSCGSNYIFQNNIIVVNEEGYLYTCGNCTEKFSEGMKKFAIIWSTEDPPIYSADGALINQQIEVVDNLEKFSRVYRDEVKVEILKFEKEAKKGDSLHMSQFGYVAAPVVRRIE